MESYKTLICFAIALLLLCSPVFAADDPVLTGPFDLQEQLDALGQDELLREVPEQARELLEAADMEEISATKLLQLSPRDFFRAIWQIIRKQATLPVRTLATVAGILILCALLGGLKTSAAESSLEPLFTTVSLLCVLGSVASPILNCITETSRTVRDAALFMLTFVPMLSATMAAAGQPITGAAYNVFLFTACQVVSQIVAQTLIPLMGVYLALCITGSIVPEIKIASATATIKSIVSWTLGFFLTVFVGLLSVQTMVAQSADTVAVKTTKFLIGSFVPVVGGALSEAYTAAQGCLRLLKTTLGAYGVIVAAFTLLPILLETVLWYLFANAAAIFGDVIGQARIAAVLRACGSVLGVLLAVILCFALLLIVSTTVVTVMGLSAG